MRNQRGNIILTALFVAIFLFFLSVALIWTNRQDIALSLSMEHKLKAQSAARTGAYEAFARLREFGELGNFQDNTLPNGAEITVELVAKEALGRRGEVLEIRARGKSGPVTSYLTLHLSDTRLAGKANESDSRVLFFPSTVTDGGAESGSEGETEPEESATSSKALYGDFIVKDGGPGALPGMVANAGPVFATRELEPALESDAPDSTSEEKEAQAEPPYFAAVIPVFSENLESMSAWGPTYLILPPHSKTAGHSDRVTELRKLVLQGEAFQWEPIEPPTELGGDPPLISPEPTSGTYKIEEEISVNNWTTLSVQGIFEKTRHHGWRVDKPLSDDIEEIRLTSVPSPEAVTGKIVDWSDAPAVQAQEAFVTRGAIHARGEVVYTHGWHYVYVPYDGQVPREVGPQHGARVVRWPCVLKYDTGWSKVWAPLGKDGRVHSEHRPDPTVLFATLGGEVYTVTEPVQDEQRKLLTLSGESTSELGDPVPDGQLLVYQEKPYLIPTNTTRPGLHALLGDDVIGFQTLPDRLPELFGEVVDTTGTEIVILGIEGGNQGEPLNPDNKLTVTARPRYDFTYSLSSSAKVAVDGDDLWAVLRIGVDYAEPTHTQAYNEPPFTKGVRTVLTRYDGQRWHILPHGLRTALKSNLSAPGTNIVAAVYSGLPEQVNRYAIMSVDTNPF